MIKFPGETKPPFSGIKNPGNEAGAGESFAVTTASTTSREKLITLSYLLFRFDSFECAAVTIAIVANLDKKKNPLILDGKYFGTIITKGLYWQKPKAAEKYSS